MTGKILIVDDEPEVLAALKAFLELEGFSVSAATNGDDMRRALNQEPFDLVTLDLGLPDSSGLDLAREIRKSTTIPIIFITARSTDIDKIVGLEVGADDYIVKPFNVREISARIRAVLRRSTSPVLDLAKFEAIKKGEYEFSLYKYHAQTRQLFSAEGQAKTLTTAEGALLEFLLRNAGKVCSRDEITAKLKGHEWSPFDRSLDTLVTRLRRKIEPSPDSPTVLMSVRGVGYVLTPEVKAN
jgi:two-component system, OmpR family, response regulator